MKFFEGRLLSRCARILIAILDYHPLTLGDLNHGVRDLNSWIALNMVVARTF